jgi:hypothetical protein
LERCSRNHVVAVLHRRPLERHHALIAVSADDDDRSGPRTIHALSHAGWSVEQSGGPDAPLRFSASRSPLGISRCRLLL